MKSIRLRTQGGVTIALEFPERVLQASTAELFSFFDPWVNHPSPLPENPKLAEFLALRIGNGSSQAPHFDHSLANEHHLNDFSDSGDPAIAGQLRIKSQQSSRFLQISSCSSVLLNPAACPFNLAD
jgi:hypothetical protein